jgi:hypothetical protein
MHVSKDMVLGFDAILNLHQKIDAPRAVPALALVPVPYRRPVRDKNINTCVAHILKSQCHRTITI